MSEEKRFKVLLAQYEHCWSDKRNYDQMIWQTPAVSLAIISILVGGLISSNNRGIVQFLGLPITLFAFLVAVVGVVQLRKHRFAQIAANDHFNYVQGLLLNTISDKTHDVLPVVFETHALLRASEKNDPRYPSLAPSHHPSYRTWFDRRRAYEWLFFLNWLVMFQLSGFTFWWLVSWDLMRGFAVLPTVSAICAILAIVLYLRWFDR